MEAEEGCVVVLTRSAIRRRYRATRPLNRRRNDLSLAVGLLELSNALDFAANVWNGSPLPVISLVFMAFGATGAFVILVAATPDIPRAWYNYNLLRRERRRLQRLQQDSDLRARHGLSERDIKTYLDLNGRELGNEVIDRLFMGVLLGFGAFTVGVGTYMAIGGDNPVVYLASNIITGYLGNVPAAIYGLMNAVWSIYGWRRAKRHKKAADTIAGMSSSPGSPHDQRVAREIRLQARRVELHAAINGVSGVLGGAGSLMTASAYIYPVGVYGYFILMACVISAIFCNVYWRRRVNYDRDVMDLPRATNQDKILSDASYAISREHMLVDFRHTVRGKSRLHLKCPDPRNVALTHILGNYFTVTLEWLIYKEQEVLKQQEIINDKEGNFEADAICAAVAVKLTRERNEVRERIHSFTSLLDRLRISDAGTGESPTVVDLAKAAYAMLQAEDLFGPFCTELANDPEMLSVFAKTLTGTQELTIDLGLLRRQLLDDANTLNPFLTLSRRTLASSGFKQARMRTRLFSELCGSFLSQQPR